MSPAEITALRRVYGELCRGYSEAEYQGSRIYIAHLTTFDQTEIDILQDEAFHTAQNRGIKTEKERLKYLNDKKIWTTKDESGLNGQRAYVEGLEKTRKNLFIARDIKQVDNQLKEGREELSKMISRKTRAIGITAEQVAERRVQLEYVRATFCRDRALEEPLFTSDEMRELDDEKSDELLMIYVEAVSRFSLDVIKKIAVQPFFINQFYLCGEQLKDFFGVPIVDLTIYQANLLSYGQYYRNIFAHNNVPKEIATDPDKIEEHVTRAANAKKMVAKTAQEGGRVGIVGATSEDFAMMGVEDGTQTMRDAAKKQYKDGKDAAKDLGFTYK